VPRFICLAIVFPLWMATVAQSGAAAQPGTDAARAAKSPPKNQFGEPEVGPVVPARSLLGMKVKRASGEPLGVVADLALDLKEGFVAMAMVAESEDSPLLPLPIDALEFDDGQLVLTSQISDAALNKTPRIKSRERLEGATRLWAASVYKQFEIEPYWQQQQQSSTWGKASNYGLLYKPDQLKTVKGEVEDVAYVAPLEGMAVGTQLTIRAGDAAHQVQLGPLAYLSKKDIRFRPGEKVEVTGSQVKIGGNTLIMAATVKTSDEAIALRDKQGNVAWEQKRITNDEDAFTSLKSIRRVPVTNSKGDDLGTIADLAIARQTGLIAYAAMACSCLPDTADKLFPIPLSALMVKPNAQAWELELPIDVLAGTPTFPVDQWPEKIERGWVEYVHVRYGRSPFGGVRSDDKKLR
jgi:sporulation protein YlmC with PRC-barrel domain